MRRWELIDSGAIPGGGSLELYRSGDDWSIRIAGQELMSNRAGSSEQDLARLGCSPIAGRAGARVLVGGLGMGYTLAIALAELGADATVVVAELVPQVVAWNRGPLAAVAGRPLDDSRVQVHDGDVAALIAAPEGGFDAILLDVDNGPQGMTSAVNDGLYGRVGLRRARAALRPGGILALWSAGADERFARRLQQAGFTVETHRARAHRGKGAHHVIWLGRR